MSKPPPDPLFVLRAHTTNVTALHFICNAFEFMKNYDPALLSGSQSGEIFVWNLKINRVQFKLHGHNDKMIMWLNYFEKCILSQGKEDYIYVWKYHDNEWIINRKIRASDVGFCPATLLHDDLRRLIVPCNTTNTLNVLDYGTGTLLSEIKPSAQGMCMCCKVCEWKNEKIIISGYENGMIVAWNIKNGSLLSSLDCHSDPVFCLDVELDHQQRGVSGSADNVLKTWHIDDNFQFTMGRQIILTNAGVNCVGIRPDGKIVIAGCWDGTLRIFSWKSLKPLAVLNFHKSAISSLQFCAGGTRNYESVFASGAKDSNIVIWSIY